MATFLPSRKGDETLQGSATRGKKSTISNSIGGNKKSGYGPLRRLGRHWIRVKAPCFSDGGCAELEVDHLAVRYVSGNRLIVYSELPPVNLFSL